MAMSGALSPLLDRQEVVYKRNLISGCELFEGWEYDIGNH